jgi:cytochrome bd-type quinol oxidase subunit 2
MVRNNAIKTLSPALAMTGWQYSEHYLSPRYEDYTLDLSSSFKIPCDTLLPFAEAMLLGALAWIAAQVFWNNAEDKKHNINKSLTNTKSYVGWNVCLSVAGAALAFVLTEAFLPKDKSWSAGAEAIAEGVGFALPSLLINSLCYFADAKAKDNTKKNIAINTLCTFAAGSLAYVFREMIHGKELTAVSPIFTFLSTVLCLGVACWADIKPKDVSISNASSLNDSVSSSKSSGDNNDQNRLNWDGRGTTFISGGKSSSVASSNSSFSRS